jgi:hypothetical protein
MKFDDRFATASDDELLRVQGAFQMPASARWIMMRESSGNSHAKNPHSSAFGAFQMIRANRKHYMGANWQSSDLGAQYQAASHYVRDRYGSWDGAKRFWQHHHWY